MDHFNHDQLQHVDEHQLSHDRMDHGDHSHFDHDMSDHDMSDHMMEESDPLDRCSTRPNHKINGRSYLVTALDPNCPKMVW